MSKKFPEGIPECGADALRFGLLAYMVQSSSINLNINTVISHRQFCNKIWNTFKFGMLFIPKEHVYWRVCSGAGLSFLNAWIINCLIRATRQITEHFQKFQLGEVTVVFRQFWLYELCDVYLEAAKPVFKAGTQLQIAEAANTLMFCLESGLKLLHPIMPFLTEELYQKLPNFQGKQPSITIDAYPYFEATFDQQLHARFSIVKKLAGGFRSIGASFNVPNHVRAKAFLIVSQEMAWVASQCQVISTLAKSQALIVLASEKEVPKGCGSGVVQGCQLFLLIKEFIDPAKELERLGKKLIAQEGFITNLEKKMSGKDYVSKVPQKVRTQNSEALEKYLLEKRLLEESISKVKDL